MCAAPQGASAPFILQHLPDRPYGPLGRATGVDNAHREVPDLLEHDLAQVGLVGGEPGPVRPVAVVLEPVDTGALATPLPGGLRRDVQVEDPRGLGQAAPPGEQGTLAGSQETALGEDLVVV